MATRLEKLLQKEAQLKAQIQQAKAIERTLARKKETRKKILIGAAVIARVQNGEWPQQDLDAMMDGFLNRPHERELFDLDGSLTDDSTQGNPDTLNQNGSAKTTQSQKKAPQKKAVAPLPESQQTFDDDFDDL